MNRSDKLKPFWLSIGPKEEPVLIERLWKAVMSSSEPSVEYRSAVIRALNNPHSKVIPFFGSFLKDLKAIVKGMPSLVVLTTHQSSDQPIKLDFVSDYQGQEHYMYVAHPGILLH